METSEVLRLFEVRAAVATVGGVGAPCEGGGIDRATTGRTGIGKPRGAARGLGNCTGYGGPCGLGRGGLGRLPLRGDGITGGFPIPFICPFSSGRRERPDHGAKNPKQDQGEEKGKKTAFACGEEKQEEKDPEGKKGAMAGVASAGHGRLQGVRIAYSV